MKKIISPVTGKSKYLLIENCEVISDIKISKDLKESLKLSAGKNGTLIVRNLPGTILNRENQNGRIYSTQVLAQAIQEARPLLETKQLLSQACEHPEGSFVSPTTASHVVTNAYIKKNVNVTVDGEPGRYDMLFMDIEVLNTDEGKNLRALLEAECSVGTSIRGVGDMEGKYVKNYEILGIDFVGNPSSSTFTRMPVSESVQVEVKDPRSLQETFTVTTSSTNVVRDLEQAATLQQQLEGIGYGTVTKTSTKLDQETDPKTGAQTSIATLETETSDDVSDLDQALQLARNAMLNGTVNVDSVTIENIKEEDETKESVEEAAPESDLETCELCGDVDSPNELYNMKTDNNERFVVCDRCKRAIVAKGEATDGEFESLTDFDLRNEKGEAVEYESEEKLNEFLNATATVGDVTANNNDVNVGGVMKGQTESDDEMKEFLDVNAEVGDINANGNKVNVGGVMSGLLSKEAEDEYVPEKAILNEEPITEAKKEDDKDPKEGKKFVLKAGNRGFVTKNDTDNAIDFTDDPKQALHFVQGHEENGMIPISNIKKILDGMGIYDTEKYFQRSSTNLGGEEKEPKEEGLAGAVLGGAAGSMIGHPIIGAAAGSITQDVATEDESVMNEENGSDTKYCAIVTINDNNGTQNEHINVSATDLDGAQKEIANLWEMKQKGLAGDGTVDIVLVDTIGGQELHFNPESHLLESSLTEDSNDPIQVNDNKVVTKLDDKHAVEKEFDSNLQAQAAAQAASAGKVDSSVLVPEAAVDEKLYSNPSEPSDDLQKEPLTDANSNLYFTLSNIDWDIDKILNQINDGETNVQDVFEALPDPLTVKINEQDLFKAASSDQSIKAYILNAANKLFPDFGTKIINNAMVDKITDGQEEIYNANSLQ